MRAIEAPVTPENRRIYSPTTHRIEPEISVGKSGNPASTYIRRKTNLISLTASGRYVEKMMSFGALVSVLAPSIGKLKNEIQ
jgi:hypothetical protein